MQWITLRALVQYEQFDRMYLFLKLKVSSIHYKLLIASARIIQCTSSPRHFQNMR